MKIRFKDDLKILAAGKSFNKLAHNEYTEKQAVLWGHKVMVAAYHNPAGELMVVASSGNIDVNIFSLYRFRWAIERLFKHLKSSGFDIEKTHITKPERFAKLIAICAIAASLIVKNGLIQNKIIPIKFRNYKDRKKQLFSFFTYGLDSLKHAIKQGGKELFNCIKKILEFDKSCSPDLYFSQLLQKM